MARRSRCHVGDHVLPLRSDMPVVRCPERFARRVVALACGLPAFVP